MELKGSCHCEKVKFKVKSHTPAPFMQCHCSICRKCQGGGGYAINIMGEYETLEVEGKEYLKEYRAVKDKKTHELCGNIRYFCGECGSHLYAYDKKWSNWVYPYASAIDTDLPELNESQIYRIMIGSKANWIPTPAVNADKHVFEEYPDCSLEQWHKENKLYVE